MFGEKEFLFFLRFAQVFGLISFFRLIFLEGGNLINSRVKLKSYPYIFTFLAIIGLILTGLLNSRLLILSLIYPISFFSISYLIIITKPSHKPFTFISILVFLTLIFYYVNGLSPTEWVKGSRNHISVLLIYTTIIPILLNELNTRKSNLTVNVIFPLLSLALSITAVGRSGILSSAVLFSGSIYYYLTNTERFRYLLYPFFILLFSSFYFLLLPYIDFINDSYLYKFNNRGIQLESRQEIINFYISQIDLKSFIFSFDNIKQVQYLGLTFHNSFIHWHFSYGIFSVFLFLLTIRSFIKLIRHNIYLSILFLVIILRSFTDQILYSDGILIGLPFILILFKISNINNQNLNYS